MSTRHIEMYSLNSWDNGLRKQFCLGYDPYFFNETSVEGIAAHKARELLQSLGVFYYRDSENSKGLLLSPNNGSNFHLFTGDDKIFEPPIRCYFFTAHVLYPAIRPIDFICPSNITKAKGFLKYKEKWGDTKQWLEWNSSKNVLHMTSKFIKTVKTKEN